jgi:hypothetical protein
MRHFIRHDAGLHARHRLGHRFLAALAVCAALGAAPLTLLAQTATPSPAPARETPRPQDIDPAVDTSRTPADAGASSRTQDLPRPQDVNPGVDTSAARPASAAPSVTPAPAGKGAAKPAPSNGATGANGAATAPAAGTLQPGGAARTQTKGKALDRLELDTTQITGNRELPKVLYIVPWKRADLGDLVGKPVNSLLDEVLAPVDRDVFKRENRYYRALMPEGGAAPKAGAAAPASGSGSAAPATKDER